MKLSTAVTSYVAHKQSQGFLFHNQSLELRSVGREIGDIELHMIDASSVLRALDRPAISTHTWRRKHSLLKHFFRYWRVMGLITHLPMPPPRGFVRSTFVPYVFSESEIRTLLASAKDVPQKLSSTVPSETLRMFLLFLYATGARPSEALALMKADVDLPNRCIHLRCRGKGAVRRLPIGQDLRRALWRYRNWQLLQSTPGNTFFTRSDGRPLESGVVYHHYNRLLQHTGISRRDQKSHKIRLYDFRPTFAVHRITAWIKEGKDLNRLLPALAAYLGQADLNATEQFLALTPSRFKKELDKLSPEQGGRWAENAEAMRVVDAL